MLGLILRSGSYCSAFYKYRCQFTLNDTVAVTITLTGGTFDLFDRICHGQNGFHTYFARQRNVCYGDGDGVAWCERAA